MRTKGKLTSWNDDKGYGFVDSLDGGRRVFIHITAFENRSRRPAVGDLVTYALSTDKRGRTCAERAALAGDRLSQKPRRRGGRIPTAVAAVFLFSVGLAVLAAKIPPVVLALYLAASLITFVAYAVDKSAARRGTWRTQESTLHMLSLFGGWPGALVAQQQLRHKSRKQSFRSVFWITVMVNTGAFVWALTPSGASAMRSLVAALA